MMKKFILALISMSLLLASGCAHIEEYDTEETADTEETTEVQTVTVDNPEYYTRFKNDVISINVYNWGEYIPDGSEEGVLNLNAEFTKLTGITVNYSTYATNEELYAKLKGGGSTYDIIIPSDYMISRMIKENMLEPLDKSNIPNFANIMDKFKSSEYDPSSKYSVPYTWGTVGIIYNVQKLEELGEGDVLFLAGSIPSSMPDDMYEQIMARLDGKGVMIVVDATKDLLVNVLKYHPFLVKPNNHELGEIFGVELKTRKDVIPYGKKLQEKGARNVLISMAGEGAVLVAEDGQVFEEPAPKGRLVNGVGAGDSMVAGFVAGWMEKKDYEHAFHMGIAAGSASAFSENLATKEEIEAVYGQITGK